MTSTSASLAHAQKTAAAQTMLALMNVAVTPDMQATERTAPMSTSATVTHAT